jgi:ATP-dependent Lhr-like helicase
MTDRIFDRFHPRLQESIARKLGWTSLRPVQDLAGHALLDGHNAVILAPTAGGKTEASMFPALSMLCEQPTSGIGVLYIAPIKALLNNQAERLDLYTQMIGLRRFVWHGDVGQSARKRFLKEPAEVLMTTPESLEVMLMSSRISVPALFGDLRMVIIDEIHALAGEDRGAHLLSVLERVAAHSEHDVQRVGLSATVGNPGDILHWLQGSSRRQGAVIDPPHKASKKALLVVLREELEDVARDAAKIGRGKKSLLFCQSRAGTEAVASAMQASGVEVFVHHSSVSAEERERAEATFTRANLAACITCTSTLELGIDIGDLDNVIQVGTTSTVSAFLQRLGRTGRREGAIANTTFLCADVEQIIQALAIIELAKDGWIEDVALTRRCWPVLAHQLLAMSLATGGLDEDRAFHTLKHVTDLSGITRDEYDAVIDHMLTEDYLFRVGQILVMGDEGERVFGKKNFMEMYSVFTSPQLFTVETLAGRELGSLEQAFVDELFEQESTFVLAGRQWLVERINLRERRVRVSAAASGKNPAWSSFVPQHLSYTLCQRIRDVLVSDDLPGILHRTAREALAARRHELAPILRDEDGLVIEDDKLAWWTFAGGRINRTLRALLATLGWSVVHDNLKLTCERPEDETSLELAWSNAMAFLEDPDTWRPDASHWEEILLGLPDFRLSKFQRALPPWAVLEMMEAFLLDRQSAERWIMSL